MISDPVRGLARRQGSVLMDEKIIGTWNLTDTQKAYARNYREYSFFLNGTEYVLIYMSAERASTDTLPFCFVLNKTTGKFLNVGYADQANLGPWISGGISAVTTVGKYVVMASNSLGPGFSTVDGWTNTSKLGVAWVRGGAYSRTFKLTVTKLDGSTVTVSYTTLSASYPNLLTTSDIPQSAPDYQKQVNDRVNAYNSAVNKWIGDAAQSIQPQFIAAQLTTALLPLLGPSVVGAVGANVVFRDVKAISCDDSGDGTLFRAVMNELDDPAKVSAIHQAGKIIRIRPKGTAEPYYLQAVADNGGTDWQTVTWKECAGVTATPGQVFALGGVTNDGTGFVIGSNATVMNAQGFTVPPYAPSQCGDLDSTGAVPYFFGKRITMLTVFMDRLVVVSNGVIFMSRVGDYFNFYRKSMLSVDDDDPIEAYALGAEDDIITKCVTYNKDLFMFGQRKQYTISGRQVLTPKTVAVTTAANEQDSMYAKPVVIGNLIYYSKYEPMANIPGPSPYVGQISQFQLGYFQDTPETYRVSQQLTKYIRGRPIEMAALASPDALFVRTDGFDTGLYVYSWIDAPGSQARQFDSWSRWEWSPNVGQIIGITQYKATLFAFTLRGDGSRTWVACDQFVMDSNLSAFPYLDSRRPNWSNNTGIIDTSVPGRFTDTSLAIDATQPEAWIGVAFTAWASLLQHYPTTPTGSMWAGFNYTGTVELTPPFVRDSNDKAIVNGRLVIGRKTVSVTDTGGLDAWLDYSGQSRNVYRFNGRVTGASNNLVGRQPVTTTTLQVPVGRANSEHRLRFTTRKWLPATISAIEWVGQFFNNSRRV